MRAAGAIVIGKTNTPEFGLGSHTYNEVFGHDHERLRPHRSAGGSSGGAAVALAARMLPGRGRQRLHGLAAQPAGLEQRLRLAAVLGPGAREPAAVVPVRQRATGRWRARRPTSRGCCRRWPAPTPRAPLSLDDDPASRSPPRSTRRRRGRRGSAGSATGTATSATEPGVLELCESALATLREARLRGRAGAAGIRPAGHLAVLPRVALAGGNLRYADLYEDPATRALMKPELVWEIEYGLRLTALDLTRAAAARDAWYAALAGMFERYDFVVAPSAQVFPFDSSVHWPREIDGHPMDTYHRWMETVVPWTMSGHPVAAVPAGFDRRGLPTGIQLIGRRHDDHGVLQLAQAYETASPVMDGTLPPLLTGETGGH